jgi:hypothetical protein
MKKSFLLAICMLVMLSNCSEDSDIRIEPVSISLNFHHSWEETNIGSEDFGELKFTNENGDLLSIDRLRYLISEIII